jgi:glycosyltransferase involved in cell wall biosynthesis
VKLSVMVITYNHERFLAQALESIFAQRVNFEYEIIVGEDCSTDGTREVLNSLCRRYPGRIVSLFRERNMGAMKNLQDTLAACQGQYIALLEGDDFWICDDKLQRQIDFLDTNPDCAISCHRARFLDEMDAAKHTLYPTLPAGAYTLDQLLGGNFVMTCTAVCRRKYLDRLPDWFLDLSLGDWPLFALLATRGSINLMDDVMATYRVHPGGIWSSRSESSRFQESIRMLKALNEELAFKHEVAIRNTIARFYLAWGENSKRSQQRAETAKCVVNCLRNGGAMLPGGLRSLLGLAPYALFGSWCKVLNGKSRTIRS